MDQKKTGEFMASLRKSQGKTQQQVADALFVSPKSVSRWESGDGLPDINILEAVGTYYGVTVDELLKGEKKNIEKEESQTAATLIEKNKGKDKLVASSLMKKEFPVFIVAISILGAFGLTGVILMRAGYLTLGMIFTLVGIAISLPTLLIGNKTIMNGFELSEDETTQNGIALYKKSLKSRIIFYYDILVIVVTIFLGLLFYITGLAGNINYPFFSFGHFISAFGLALFIASFILPYFLIRHYFVLEKSKESEFFLRNRIQFSLMFLALFISFYLVSITIKSDGEKLAIFPLVEYFFTSGGSIFKIISIVLLAIEIALAVIGFTKKWKWMSFGSIILSIPTGILAYVDYVNYGGDSYGITINVLGAFTLAIYLGLFIWLLVSTYKAKAPKADN